jgi:hypothetical protein
VHGARGRENNKGGGGTAAAQRAFFGGRISVRGWKLTEKRGKIRKKAEIRSNINIFKSRKKKKKKRASGAIFIYILK